MTYNDLATTVNRTSASYTPTIGYETHVSPIASGRMGVYNPTVTAYNAIKGELVGERFTFLDTKPNEGFTVHLPFLSLEGTLAFCCWKCGDTITDHWLSDLERFDYAKGFDVKGSWIFRK